MRASIKKTVEVTLVLDEGEARWLKARVQNSVDKHESQQDYDIRNQIFEELKEVLDS